MDNSPTGLLSLEQSVARDANGEVARSAGLEIRQLQRHLLRAVSASANKEPFLSAIGNVVVESISPTAMRYFHRDGEQQLAPIWQFASARTHGRQEVTIGELLSLSELTCKKGCLQIHELEQPSGALAISIPVFLRNNPPEALAVVFPPTAHSLDRAITILQLAASHITMWYMLQELSQADADAQASAALLEFLAQAETCDTQTEAGYALAGALKEHLGCQRVAIGLSRRSRRTCRLIGLSEYAKFDRNSDFIRAVTAALDEAMLRGSLAKWPCDEQADRHATRAQQSLCTRNGFGAVVSAPLEDEAGEPLGAWLFLGDSEFTQDHQQLNFIRASAYPVACCMQLLQRAEKGPVARLTGKILDRKKSWIRKSLLALAGVLAVVFCLPFSYTVKCDCQVQPFTQRYISAPFAGKLETALGGPGDIVRQGTVLARMDGRDIRWELAGVVADRGKAVKQRDAALASHDMVAAQLAKLEIERLDHQAKILEQRSAHLDIKTPIDGVVISGDLERAEGAPLTIGQVLFEVAPLDKMVVELAVPEDEIQHVRNNLAVSFQLDAFPRNKWTGTISAVHPRSETKDDRNIFVAEVLIDNSQGTLRPGMNGRAKICTDSHPLAWNLFHKPWEFVMSALGL